MSHAPVIIVTRNAVAVRYVSVPGEGQPVVLDIDLTDIDFDPLTVPERSFKRFKDSMFDLYDESGLDRTHPAFDAFEDAVDAVIISPLPTAEHR